MEENYKSKYMKYKMKYLDLKNRQNAIDQSGAGLIGNLFKQGSKVISKVVAPVKQIAKEAGQEIKTQAVQAVRETSSELKNQAKQSMRDLKSQAIQRTNNYINTIGNGEYEQAPETAEYEQAPETAEYEQAPETAEYEQVQ